MAARSSQYWPVQDAKARFSELVEASLERGPQIVTRRGLETVVVVDVRHWRRLEQSARPALKQLLLTDAARAEIPVPSRRRWRRRASAEQG